MSTKIFGTRADGTIVFCRALPENRGKGNCPHGDHMELTEEQLKSGFIVKFNEAAIQKHIETGGTSLFPELPKKPKESSTARKKRSIAELKKLREDAEALAPLFTQEDFDLVKGVSDDFARVVANGKFSNISDVKSAESMENYLLSDEPRAVKLREYLGEDTDYTALSDLLMTEVGGMSSAHRWSTSGRHSIARVILTNLNNDMDRTNYVTSVLYFKGKCCYCEKSLSRNPGGKVALPTGEHITPVTPMDETSAVGGTRFGNVALACNRCNKSRANSDLHMWLKDKGVPVAVEKRGRALARINSFRKFAGYREYSASEAKLIREAAERVQVHVDALRPEGAKIERGLGDPIREKIAVEIEELQKIISLKN